MDGISKDIDIDVLEKSLKAVSQEFDLFIGKCVSGNGEPVAPSRGDVMKARASLPLYCENAFKKRVKK